MEGEHAGRRAWLEAGQRLHSFLRRIPVPWDPDATDVFCGPGAQKSGIYRSIVDETPHFYVVPNHKPIGRGHLLIVSKKHYPCTGAFPDASLDRELNGLIARVNAFHRDIFGSQTMMWENDFRWQSVHHQHLQLAAPDHPVTGFPRTVKGHRAATWERVRELFRKNLHYQLLERNGERRVFINSAQAVVANQWLAQEMKVPRDSRGRWVRHLDEHAAAETGRLFSEWKALRPPDNDLDLAA